MDPNTIEYVVFDVETTGLSPLDGDRIVEIGAIKIKNGECVDTFESFVNPEIPIPIEASRVHNITSEMLVDSPTAKDVLPKMIDFIGGACLIGHNVKFDLDFLCFQLSLLSRRLRNETPAIDTLKMARALLPQFRSHRLGSLAISFGIRIDTTHRALADVQLTVDVFKRLTFLAQDQGYKTFQEFLKHFSVVKPQFKYETVEQDSFF